MNVADRAGSQIAAAAPRAVVQSRSQRAPGAADPLIVAVARYVEALDRRYPAGPEQLHQERLDVRARRVIMRRMLDRPQGPAA
jgi:hypothetical protein